MTDYGPSWYRVRPQVLATLRAPQPWRPVLQWVLAWVWIVIFVKIALWNYWLAPLCALFIVGRAGVFLQLVHEATHHCISKGGFNDWFGNWLCAYPIGLSLSGYKTGHLAHHADTNGPRDPASDREKYRVCDIRDGRLWGLFLKDCCGWTALTVRSAYQQNTTDRLRDLGGIAMQQAILLGLCFGGNLWAYLLLWPLPLMTLHMVLMRIRGIGEHGLGIQTHQPVPFDGTRYTRSFGTPKNRYRFLPFVWLERALIGSLNVYYHHEHHLYPTVPYYSLPKLHDLIVQDEAKHTPEIFVPGYFSCLWATR